MKALFIVHNRRFQLLTVVITLIVICGAGLLHWRLSLPNEVDRRQFRYTWDEGGTSAEYHLSAGQNFYFTIRDRYPHVGALWHSVSSDEWNPSVERDAITAAIIRCRRNFTKVFKSDKIAISAVDPDEIQKFGTRLIPFHPQLVVILIRNNAEYPKGVGGESKGRLPFEEWTKPIKAGYVFPSDLFFSDAEDIGMIIESGMRDENPVHFIHVLEPPTDEMVLDIVDRYERSHGANKR